MSEGPRELEIYDEESEMFSTQPLDRYEVQVLKESYAMIFRIAIAAEKEGEDFDDLFNAIQEITGEFAEAGFFESFSANYYD